MTDRLLHSNPNRLIHQDSVCRDRVVGRRVSQTQRRLLEKVSICPQSFTMDMAQALSAESGTSLTLCEHLENLVQQQLLVRTIGSMGVEYSILQQCARIFPTQSIRRRPQSTSCKTCAVLVSIIDGILAWTLGSIRIGSGFSTTKNI